MNGYNSMTFSGDYLQHHGIKGQHWGVRRWQNEDGSLTPAGYEHYGYGINNPNLSDVSKRIVDHAKSGDQMLEYMDGAVEKLANRKSAGIVDSKYNMDLSNRFGGDYKIVAGSTMDRIANSDEKIDDKRKYVSVTDNDRQSYSEMSDALWADYTKGLSSYMYRAIKDIDVAGTDAVEKYIIDKWGDDQIRGLADRLYIKAAMYTPDKHENGKRFFDGNENSNSMVARKMHTERNRFISNVMKTHFDDISEHFSKEGYDAIADPEDWGFESATILLKPMSSISLVDEMKWG